MRTTMASRNEPASGRYCFDDVVINCHDFSVFKAAQKKAVTPRAFDVLRYLIEHSDRVIEKPELFEQLWKEKFVTDNALTRTVTEIRHALGDSADSPRYIETVPKRGYRFIGKLNGASETSLHETASVGSLSRKENFQPTINNPEASWRLLSKNHLRRGISQRAL